MAAQVHYWSKCCRRCPHSFCSDATNGELESAQLPQNGASRGDKSDLIKAFGVLPRAPALPAAPVNPKGCGPRSPRSPWGWRGRSAARSQRSAWIISGERTQARLRAQIGCLGCHAGLSQTPGPKRQRAGPVSVLSRCTQPSRDT